jgi:hypothetical protein
MSKSMSQHFAVVRISVLWPCQVAFVRFGQPSLRPTGRRRRPRRSPRSSSRHEKSKRLTFPTDCPEGSALSKSSSTEGRRPVSVPYRPGYVAPMGRLVELNLIPRPKERRRPQGFFFKDVLFGGATASAPSPGKRQ